MNKDNLAKYSDYLKSLERQTEVISRSMRSLQYFRERMAMPEEKIDSVLAEALTTLKTLKEQIKTSS